MDDILKDAIMNGTVDGTVPCRAALGIAEELEVSPRTVGEALDKLGIRITHCQLGCFE